VHSAPACAFHFLRLFWKGIQHVPSECRELYLKTMTTIEKNPNGRMVFLSKADPSTAVPEFSRQHFCQHSGGDKRGRSRREFCVDVNR